MKTLLNISICLNLGLAGGLIFMALDRPQVAGPVSRLAAEPSPPMHEKITAATPNPVLAEPKPFHWSQLDAKDYHIYVKNLRTIACPEPTVRAIVSADVAAVYQIYRRELERKLSNLAGGSWSPQLASLVSEQALKSRLQQLPGEEAAKINDLLGLEPVPVQIDATASSPIPAVRRHHPVWADVTPAMPMVFQNVDLAALGLNEEQSQVITTLRDGFMEDIGGTNQDPNDPAYLARWQKAQLKTDSLLQGMMGLDAYAKFQTMAENQGSPSP